MATITPTASGNVDSLSWRSADTLVINDGYTITVNTPQTKIWNGVTINTGKLRIENASTTTPIIFRMGNTTTTAPAITPATGLGAIEIDGDWIEIGTGDGTASQTFTLPFNDHCAAIWVETAPSSGVYRPWSNILRRFPISGQEWLLEGWDQVADGIRGYVFKQTPNASPVYHTVQTNSSTTNTSRTITITNTAGIFPGAVVVGSAGIPGNSVVERVLNGTQLELNQAATATSSTVTITVYNTFECWTSNEVVFGDGVHGNVVPDGCKVRVPNIVLTCARGINVSTGNSGLNINLTNGGVLTADTCLFAFSNNTFTTPQTLSLSHCGFSMQHNISKCYGLTINDVLFSVPPQYPYLVSIRLTETYQVATLSWGYLSGTIDNLYIYNNTPYIGSVPQDVHNFLSFQYCEGIVCDSLHVQVPIVGANFGMLGLYFCNRNSFNNVTLIGSTRFANLYSSNENTLTNVTYGTLGFAENHYPPQQNSNWNFFAHDRDGNELTNGTTYYLKHRRLYALLPGAPYLESARTFAFTPYYSTTAGMVQEFYVSPSANAVVLSWDDRRPTHTAPAFEIYRSTTAGVPVRDAGTRIWTTNTVTTLTYTDATAVNGTRYYYVLRKHISAGVYEDTQVVDATPSVENNYSNFVTNSLGFNNASWTKGSVSIANNADVNTPFSTAMGAAFATSRRAQVTGANGTLTTSVASLSIGQTYTASIWIRFAGSASNATTAITTTPMRLTFGTAFVDFNATNQWVRQSVSFTATATSHNFVLRFNTSNNWVDLGNAQVNLGASATADINTTAAAVTTATFAPTSACAFNSMTPGDTTCIAGIWMATDTLGGGWQSWFTCLGTTNDFTPSWDNLIMLAGASLSTIKISTSSSRNVISGVTQSGKGDRNSFLECTFSSSDNIVEGVTIEPSAGYWTGVSAPFGNYAYLVNDANRNILRNWDVGTHFEYNTSNRMFNADNTANGNVLQNWRGKKGLSQVLPYNNGMAIKGVQGGACQNNDGQLLALVPMDRVGGVGLSFTGIYDTHFAELYHTTTTGAIHLLFTASTSDSPPYTLTGTAAFSNTGRLYLPSAGDSATYTWPHKIYGISGFQNIAPIWLSNDLSGDNTEGSGREKADSILLEFQIDTGSGWGSWTEATAANLSALTVSASDGFYLKLRLTVRQFIKYTGQTINFTEGMTIRQQTSGATARVVKDFDYGTTGLLLVDTITGTWTNTAALDILRNSDSVSMCTGTVLVNTSYVLGPSFTSFVQGLKIFTTVDQSVLYPSDAITLTLTGLQSGSDITFLSAGTETVLLNIEDNAGSTASYEYFTASGAVDIAVYKPGYMPAYIRNYPLSSTDSSLPITQVADPSYLE